MPLATPSDLLCPRRTALGDYTDFIARFAELIASSSVPSSTFDALDTDLAGQSISGGSALTYVNRDYWLDACIKRNLGLNDRLTIGSSSAADPLGLTTGRTNCIIIDPQNADAILVTRGTNDCQTQGSVSAGSLWSGDTYLQTLWYDLNSLDELNRLENGSTIPTVRRFPEGGGEIYIYVRGGEQVLSTGSIGLCRNDSGWTKPSRIVIRNYPGETPTIKFGSKLITSGGGSGKYDIRFEGGGQFQFRIRRSNVTWEGITFRGYRDGASSTRIYGIGCFYVNSTDPSDSSVIDNTTFRNLQITDILGTEAAGTYQDAGWDRYDEINSLAVDTETTICGTIFTHGTNTKVLNCYSQNCPADFPMTADQLGEGIYIGSLATNSLVSHCLKDGLTPHSSIAINGSATVEFCELSNYHNTPIGIGVGTGNVVRFNRIQATTHESKQSHGIQVTPSSGTSSGSIYGNVMWDWQFNGGLAGSSNAAIALVRTTGGTTIDNWEIYRNIVYGGGLELDDDFSGAAANNINNINIHHNVFVDYPLWNAQFANFDAPVLAFYLTTPLTSSFRGSQMINNIIYRTDGDTPVFGYRADAGSTTFLTIAQLNTFPNCSGNLTVDPGFTDPDTGDFTPVSGSPTKAMLLAPTPVRGVPAWNQNPIGEICDARGGRIQLVNIAGALRVNP